jgi:hypothetical protein
MELRAGYTLLGAKGSISSTKLRRCLYTERGYPEQKKGRGETAKVSTDVEALLKLSKKFPNDPFLADVLLHRKLESVLETLQIQTDPDGRVRCGYNLVGTETGRLTCYTSPTGSGANLQTITKKLRKLYTADGGHWLFQCDLSGADGWTVAAHCLRHGDPTMWDDYTAGLKPAKIICLMKNHGAQVNTCSRDELLAWCLEESKPGGCCDQDSWDYFGCKRVQHMSNYAGQARTGVKQIMIDSYKITGAAFYMTEAEFEIIQRYYFVRYCGLFSWHNWAKNEVMEGRNLTSASGHTRKFFGRRRSWDYKTRSHSADHETWKEFLADEPQENTTFATNCALSNLCFAHENFKVPVPVEKRGDHIWLGDHALDQLCHGKIPYHVEPLQHGHDALVGQFRKNIVEFAVQTIRQAFQNVLTIANTTVTIPFEGAYGPSWGQLGEKWGGGSI